MDPDNSRGFTFLELIIILLVAGTLAAIAIPRFISFQQEAQLAVEQQQVGTVKVGINSYYIQSITSGRVPQYPPVLDAAGNYSSSSPDNPFFGFVVDSPGVSKPTWNKLNSYIYQGPSGNYYTYDPSQGNFLSYSGSLPVGSVPGQVSNFLPALSANSYSTSQWEPSAEGGLYSPWSGIPLNFSMDFATAGNYTFDISAINQADHPLFCAQLGVPMRTDWHLPTGYTQFDVQVLVDGVAVNPANFNIAASDTVTNSNSFSTYVGSGQHTVTLLWTNDMWTPDENGDANIQFQNLSVTKQ